MKNDNFFYGESSSIKIPLSVWENNNQKDSDFDTMTIKVEPLDLDWEDDLTLLDLKNKMGLLSPKKRRKKMKTVTGARRSQKNICVICDAVIRGRASLINHYLIHKENRIKINAEKINKCDDNDFLRCCVCMKEFILKADLEKHADYHMQRPFFCELCNKSFKQSQNFLTHMNSHQASTVAMKCNDCDFSTTFKLAYDKHVKSHTREEYKCELCDKIFPARTWFIEHKNFHTGEKPFSCEECGKCFPYSRYLTAHKKSMHPHCYFKEPELNECQICKKRYSHRNSLRLHMKVHTGENTYLCDVCGKSLSSTDKLQLHKRIHTGYKPYVCTVCEKAFTKKDILTDHMRVHSGEKPFACETCGKCFSQRSPLTIHRRYHTGERPYVCHLCNKGFVSKGILGIHLKQGKH